MGTDPRAAVSDVAIAELGDLLVVPLHSAQLNDQVGVLLDTLSARLSRARPRALILDLGAITALDHHEFEALTHIARLARLLGCETIAAGITPGVAACLVMIDADPAGIRFCRDMGSVLRQHVRDVAAPEA